MNTPEKELTISDWVTFLTGEKYGVLSNLFAFGSLVVAAFSIIQLTKTIYWISIIGIVIVVLLALFVSYHLYFGVVSRFELRGKLAGKLLGKIMSRELRNEEAIRREWLAGVAEIEKKKKFLLW